MTTAEKIVIQGVFVYTMKWRAQKIHISAFQGITMTVFSTSV